MIDHHAYRERLYAALKMADPDLYRLAIEAAEAVTLKHHLATPLAAEIEAAVVFIACEALSGRGR